MDERKASGDESKLALFRRRVQHEFGRNLENATPANVRDFMENYQEADSSIKIPKVLQPYMGGQEIISKK